MSSSVASRKAERLEKKLQSQLRACQKEPGNKVCADCTERLPQWIISDFNTFVCTPCSGIHREFSHRVKSISLATFSEQEVANVKAGGNEASNNLYMAKYRQGYDLPKPQSARAEKHREFIRTKYVDKRWYGTLADLEREKQLDAEREEAKARRDAQRSSGSSSSTRKKEQRGGSSSSSARQRRGTTDRGLRKVEPVAAAAEKPAVTPAAKQVDLLDFLSDDPAPATPAVPNPAVAQAPPAAAAASQQPWDAFGAGGGAAASLTPVAAATAAPASSGFASWAAFGDAPEMPQNGAPPQQQQQLQQQQQPAAFAFQEASPAAAAAAPGATTVFNASFPAGNFPPPPPPGGGSGLQQQPQQQQQQPPLQQPPLQQPPLQQPPSKQPPLQQPQGAASPAFGSQQGLGASAPATLMSPAAGVATAPSPRGWPAQGLQQQQGFAQASGGFPTAGVRGSAPGTPVQPQQQQQQQQRNAAGVFFPAGQGVEGGSPAAAGFAASFEALSVSSPAATSTAAQQPQGFPGAQQGHQQQQQGGGGGGAVYQQNPQQEFVQQQQRSVFAGVQQPQQQGFAGFGQQAPQQFQPQHPQQQQFGLANFPQAAQQQQPQQQHPQWSQQHFHQQQQFQPQQQQQQQPQALGRGTAQTSQGSQQQQVAQQYWQQQQQMQQQQMQQQHQQMPQGAAASASAPLQSASPAGDVDPFAELAEGGASGAADWRGPGGEVVFEKGDEVLYIRGSDPPLEGVVRKVHLEDEVPYYTVLIAVTGREKNTDRQHLRHKGAKGAVANGHGPQQGQQGVGPDAFATLGGVASWANPSTSTPATPAPPAPAPAPAALQNVVPQQQQQQQQQQLQQQYLQQQQQPQQATPPRPAQQAQAGPPVPPKPSSQQQQRGGFQGLGGPPSLPMPPVPGQQVPVAVAAGAAGGLADSNPFGGAEDAGAGAAAAAVAPQAGAAIVEQSGGGNPFDMF